MKPERFRFRIGDIPRKVVNRACAEVGNYSVSLIHEGEFAGSGTLIRYGSLYGILTAHHVVHGGRVPFDFNSRQRLGITITNFPADFHLEMRYLRCVDIGVPVDACKFPEKGPDLSVILLPRTRVGEIAARKAFYNLEYKRQERMAIGRRNDGLWLIMGTPKTDVSEEGPRLGFSRVVKLPSIGCGSGIKSRFRIRNFDYLDIGTDAEGRKAQPIFNGMSGGGVWRVPIHKPAGRTLAGMNFNDVYLAGVIFCQMPDPNPEKVRCHGPRSIYQNVVRKLSRIEP